MRPPGLKAVVSQEPVYDDYRYLYGDGIRRENSLATPALYDAIAATPGPLPTDTRPTTSRLNDHRSPAASPATTSTRPATTTTLALTGGSAT